MTRWQRCKQACGNCVTKLKDWLWKGDPEKPGQGSSDLESETDALKPNDSKNYGSIADESLDKQLIDQQLIDQQLIDQPTTSTPSTCTQRTAAVIDAGATLSAAVTYFLINLFQTTGLEPGEDGVPAYSIIGPSFAFLFLGMIGELIVQVHSHKQQHPPGHSPWGRGLLPVQAGSHQNAMPIYAATAYANLPPLVSNGLRVFDESSYTPTTSKVFGATALAFLVIGLAIACAYNRHIHSNAQPTHKLVKFWSRFITFANAASIATSLPLLVDGTVGCFDYNITQEINGTEQSVPFDAFNSKPVTAAEMVLFLAMLTIENNMFHSKHRQNMTDIALSFFGLIYNTLMIVSFINDLTGQGISDPGAALPPALTAVSFIGTGLATARLVYQIGRPAVDACKERSAKNRSRVTTAITQLTISQSERSVAPSQFKDTKIVQSASV